MPLRPRPHLAASPRRGIALLVTILLLSFLVIIMVALSSLVRVETKIAANQDTLAQARQNALMGLNIALGKLQETAGPDLRVTARADVMENDPAVINSARKYQMNLTGVWDTSGGGAPRLLTWLVNGNEDLENQAPPITPDAHPTSGQQRIDNQRVRIFDVADGVFGSANPQHLADAPLFDDSEPAAFQFDPSTLPGSSTAPDFRFGDGRVTLVGNGSVDLRTESAISNTFENGNSYKKALAERVILRKSPIIVDGAKIPGKASGTEVTIGNYAYWVGDAGIKASLGAANRAPDLAYDDSTGADYDGGTTASRADFINRQWLHTLQLQGSRLDLVFHPGLLNNNGYLPDVFDGANVPAYLNDPSPEDRQGFYGVLGHPLTRDAYARLFVADQIKDFLREGPFVDPLIDQPPSLHDATTADATIKQFQSVVGTRLKQLYHDVTPQTFSVLTNMRTGGLRTDLSQVAGLAKFPAIGIQSYTDVWRGASPQSQASAATSRGLLQRTLTTPTANKAYPITPVITELSLLTDIVTDNAGKAWVNVTSLEVELWNPYNAELTLSNALQLQLIIKDDADVIVTQVTDGLNPPRNYSAEKTFANLPAQPILNSGETLQPGEIRYISLTPSITRAALGPTGAALTFPVPPPPGAATPADCFGIRRRHRHRAARRGGQRRFRVPQRRFGRQPRSRDQSVFLPVCPARLVQLDQLENLRPPRPQLGQRRV